VNAVFMPRSRSNDNFARITPFVPFTHREDDMANTTTVDNSTLASEPPSQRQTNLRALLLALLAVLLFAWWWFDLREPLAPSGGEISPPTVTIGPGSDVTPAPVKESDARVATKAKAAAKPKPRTPSTTTARPIASNLAPKYPVAALRRNEGGMVLLRVNVGSDGTPTDIDVAQRSGSRDLDRAAISAVSKWQFRPATRNGRPVASTVVVPVEFRPTDLASL